MKKKKVFIYIHQCILKGGVEKVFYNLLNNLPPDRYDVTVLSVMAYFQNDINTNLYPSFVKRKWFYYDEWSTNWFRKTYQRLHNKLAPLFYKWLLKFQFYDVAIAAQEGSYAKFVLDHVHAKKKLLWIHNDITKCHWTEKVFGNTQVEKKYYEQFDSVVCVSEDVKRSMQKLFGKMNNLSVRYNPIDTLEIDNFLQAELPGRDASPLFVCVGRLANQKGYDRLLSVCQRLNEEGYKYNINILGDGEDREMLQMLLKKMHIENVFLLGNKSNPFVYMKISDWLLLPSRHEGFGMVLHESIYCETPIITTLVAGAKELLGDSDYGLVIENSEEGIYNAMKMVLDTPELQKYYKNKAIERKSFVDIRKRISDIESLF